MKHLIVPCLFVLLFSCSSEKNQEVNLYPNPPADGFNEEGSDPKAVDLADQVMEAMGGRKAWDETRYLAWNFFGFRKLLWDKQENLVRVESIQNDDVTVLDMNSMSGEVKRNGEIESDKDSISHYLKRAHSAWINDSYWLVMPFKLKDSGVTLAYVGTDTVLDGQLAEIIQLGFQNVGDTPDNKYLVYISPENQEVLGWAYFATAEQEEPNFEGPWRDYKNYGGIMLAGNRGERELSEIAVLDDVPEEAFTSTAPLDWEALMEKNSL